MNNISKLKSEIESEISIKNDAETHITELKSKQNQVDLKHKNYLTNLKQIEGNLSKAKQDHLS